MKFCFRQKHPDFSWGGQFNVWIRHKIWRLFLWWTSSSFPSWNFIFLAKTKMETKMKLKNKNGETIPCEYLIHKEPLESVDSSFCGKWAFLYFVFYFFSRKMICWFVHFVFVFLRKLSFWSKVWLSDDSFICLLFIFRILVFFSMSTVITG